MTARYNGKELVYKVPGPTIEEQLEGLGLSKDYQRSIREWADSYRCCDEFDTMFRDYREPYIDYGTRTIIGMYADVLGHDKVCDWALFRYCPFCGKGFGATMPDARWSGCSPVKHSIANHKEWVRIKRRKLYFGLHLYSAHCIYCGMWGKGLTKYSAILNLKCLDTLCNIANRVYDAYCRFEERHEQKRIERLVWEDMEDDK